jgi:peptidoglycan/LPS O-acetylase OafA/YrhL
MAFPQKLQFRLRYAPTLDGIRGIAVLGVMAVHAAPQSAYTQWGYLGVDVFFTLSGFLITAVLLQEWSETGSIDFRNFYARRALRLLPALSLLLLASLLPVNPISAMERVKAALIALFYSANWVRAFAPDVRLAALGHTWSLSIEEQFYLLWPIALITILRFEALRKRVVPILVIAVFACATWRLFLWSEGRSPLRLYNGLDTRADSLLAGCALSVMLAFGVLKPGFAMKKAANLLALIAMPLVLMIFISEWHDDFMLVAGYSVVAVLSAALIFAVVRASSTRLSGILSFPPLVWTGRISYGLYLWHYPVFEYVRGRGLPRPLALLGMYGSVFLVAALSFYCVERPFLRMKQKFKAPEGPPAGVLVATPQAHL